MYYRWNIVWHINEHKWGLLRQYCSIRFEYSCGFCDYILELPCPVKYNDTNIADCVNINRQDVPILFYK